MRSNLRFAALFVIATAAFAQHGGGFRGGFGTGFGSVTGRFGQPGFTRSGIGFGESRLGAGRRFGNDLFAPYFPFFGYYDDNYLPPAGYLPGGDSAAPVNVFIVQPSPGATVQPAPPPLPHSVIHEYKWSDEAPAGAGDSPTFSIALKDGNSISAVAAWVQDGKLHFVDSQDTQRVLSPDEIDREATRRLNQQKNLHLQLPPG